MRAAAIVALAVAVALVAMAASGSRTDPPRAAIAGALPPPVPAAFTPGRPRRLRSAADATRYAPVRRTAVARAAPRASARVVAALSTRTPEDTDNIVQVLAHREDGSGAPWVKVALAVLPNGTTGWVPRRTLGGYVTVTTRLDVDLEHLRATLYRAGRAVLSAPVGVGAPGSPTPRGRFYVRNRLSRYSSRAYGPVAFGTSARSPTATDWVAGGYVGIHGTDEPALLPGRVSHGCIRMRNADIVRLAARMPVGTPITIR